MQLALGEDAGADVANKRGHGWDLCCDCVSSDMSKWFVQLQSEGKSWKRVSVLRKIRVDN